jgi:hypothetical protein
VAGAPTRPAIAAPEIAPEAGPPHRLRDRGISLGQRRISLAQTHENSRNLRRAELSQLENVTEWPSQRLA